MHKRVYPTGQAGWRYRAAEPSLPAGGDELHPHLPAITWRHAATGCHSDGTNMDHAAATTLIQCNQPTLPDQKDVYLLLGIPNNDVRPVTIADHNTF
jgi:hypothetical protein